MKRLIGMTLAIAVCSAGCSATAAKSTRCETYPSSRAASILGSGLVVDHAAAVKSEDHSKAWYVAIRFHGPGVESGEVGVWATNDLSGGTIIAVDGFAQQFSSFPPNDGFSSTDKGASEAKTCV